MNEGQFLPVAEAVTLAPSLPDVSGLPPDLAAFRLAPLPDEEATKLLPHMDRMQRIDRYNRIKHDFGKPLRFEELRHMMLLLGALRAETLRVKRAETAQAKKASAGPVKQMSLEDL